MIDFGKYINIPFNHNGDDFNGCNCYTLYRLIFRNEKGIELPNYICSETFYDKNEDIIVENITKSKFIKVSPPYKVFDGLIFFHGNSKIANHIGMWIGNNKFIHVYKGAKSRVERFDDYWKRKLYGVCRYQWQK